MTVLAADGLMSPTAFARVDPMPVLVAATPRSAADTVAPSAVPLRPVSTVAAVTCWPCCALRALCARCSAAPKPGSMLRACS